MADFELFELLAAPILAMNEAEAQNSARYVELLEEYAFETTKEDGTRRLSTFSFSFLRAEPDGSTLEQSIEIPLVQFLPVSGVCIESAKLNYALKINPSADKSSGKLKMLGRLAENIDSNTPLSGNLNIEIQLKQVDMPQGVLSLLETSTQAIRKVNAPLRAPDPTNTVDEKPIVLPDDFIDFEVVDVSDKTIRAGQDYLYVLRPIFTDELQKLDREVEVSFASSPKGALSFKNLGKVAIKHKEEIKLNFLTLPRISKYKPKTQISLLIKTSVKFKGFEVNRLTHTIPLERKIARRVVK